MNILFNHQKWPVIFFVILCACVIGCKKITPNNTQVTFLPQYKDSQLVVWRKPGVTTENMNLKVNNLKAKYTGTLDRIVCQSCDDSLELWSGTAIAGFINSEVASPSTRPRGNPTGEDDTLRYSLNIIVHLPDEDTIAKLTLQTVLPITTNTPQVTVAVFDTGVDPAVTDNFTSNAPIIPTCRPGGDRGWNFIDNNNNITDAFTAKHGTVVSKFIIDQVRANAAGNRVNILPVKIFNADGKSDLFSVLCGFSYAQKAGAKVINASFGFYDYGAEPNPVLLKYVEKVLTKNNVLLIASAGNKIDEEDIYAATWAGLPASGLRNMDIHHFYPGGLAKLLPNVYCVTTARLMPTADISPNQNYSKVIVDIGTIADFPDFYFKHPFDATRRVIGSSFATPVFTGKLVSWYSAIATMLDNKENVLRYLKDNGVVFDDVPAFEARIKERHYVR